MYILSVHMWFQNLIRQFFFNLDKVIFNFIPTMYSFLTDIARTSILSQADIASIANRIYQLLAIFMIFKVIFSLIMYVVNPDDFSDKSKGVSKLGVNIVISLSLLVLTPYIFSYAYQLQTIILEDDSLGTLVFGDINSDDKSIFNSAGDNIAYNAMSPFFLPNTSIDGLGECLTLTIDGKFNEKCSGLDLSKDPEEMVVGDSDTLAGLASDVNEDAHASFTSTDIANYVYGVERQNLGLMFRQEVVLATADVGVDSSNEHIFDYKFIFSTAVGVVIIFLLISFSMDVAVRSIKLSFLQLISPIPILSYIDPKSGKDGMFKKWYQLCFKTYVSLFVRLLALYFGIFIITKIDKISDVVDGSYQTNMFVKIFVIIGVLMFVKQLPKMLEGLGIKLDGDGKFTLNPLKKFENEALGGKQISGAAKGLIAGGAIGMIGAASGAGVGRAFGGVINGISSGIKGKKMGEIRKDNVVRNAEMRRAIASGSSIGERMSARFSSFAGTPGRLGRIEHEKLDLQNRMDNLRAEKNQIDAEIKPQQDLISKKNKVKSASQEIEDFLVKQIKGGKAKELSDRYNSNITANEVLSNNIGKRLTSDVVFYDKDGLKHTIAKGSRVTQADATLAATSVEGYLNKTAKKELGEKYFNNDSSLDSGAKATFDAMNNNYKKQVEIYNKSETDDAQKLTTADNYNDMHSQQDTIDISVREKQLAIETGLEESARIQGEIDTLSARSTEVDAEARDARASMQAVHGQEGGPSSPDTITQATHTQGYRSGGYGSGEAPAMSGFGGGRPGGRPGGPPPGGMPPGGMPGGTP